jgi:integrase
MAITLKTFPKKKPGTRYHSDRCEWVGYKADIRVRGKRYRGGPFPTRREAENYIEQLKIQSNYKKAGLNFSSKGAADIRLKDLIEKRLADHEGSKRYELVHRVLYYLLGITGENARVIDVNYQHLKQFNEKRSREKTVGRNTPVSESTIDREMTEISSLLKSAGHYFEELEDYQPPKIPRLQLVDIRRERRIADWEKEELIKYFDRPREAFESDGQYQDRIAIGHAFEFALLTSSRRKEVVRLRKTDYQPRQDILRITRWKTIRSKRQSVSTFSPVPKRVKEILKLRAELNPDGEYFFSDKGEDSYGYLKSMKLACKKLGIPYGRFTSGGLIFHDTRHTFVSELIDSGIDLETTRDLAGLSRDMILRYAHTSPEQKRRAAEAIDRRNGFSDHQMKLEDLYDRVRSGQVTTNDFVAEILEFWTKSGHKTMAVAR